MQYCMHICIYSHVHVHKMHANVHMAYLGPVEFQSSQSCGKTCYSNLRPSALSSLVSPMYYSLVPSPRLQERKRVW